MIGGSRRTKRAMVVLVAVGAVLAVIAGVALATPPSGATAETARGPLVAGRSR